MQVAKSPWETYCRGYNCRHRWAPVISEIDWNLFIAQNWNDKLEISSNDEKKVLLSELDFARRASALGKKVEINDAVKNLKGKIAI